MDDEVKKMKDRIGEEGMRELAQLDAHGMALLGRLHLVSSIAANLNQFDEDLAKKFYESQVIHINMMQDDLAKITEAFTRKRGEV